MPDHAHRTNQEEPEMTMRSPILTPKEAMAAFQAADDAWQAEMVRCFGARDASEARYEKRGRGTSDDAIGAAYQVRENARRAADVRD